MSASTPAVTSNTIVQVPSEPVDCRNWVAGRWENGGDRAIEVRSPYTGEVIGKIRESSPAAVDHAVTEAKKAQLSWGMTPIKERTQVMFRLREILMRDQDKLSHRIASESGKLLSEARAGLMKGIEVLEFAISLQNLDRGGRMEVSRGVWCEERREPLGVVAGITPFNFPAMVPMWMMPIAMTLGNAFVWKPSDKTPLTSLMLAEAFKEAGLPDGVLTVIQGGRETVETIIEHPDIHAVGFVGSTPVAKTVYTRATSHGKRALCLGGAKNHIILMPDADPEVTSAGVSSSFTGCAGQRCMAASVLLAVGDDKDGSSRQIDKLLAGIVEVSARLRLGRDIGAIISEASLQKLHRAVDRAVEEGAKLLLDGRKSAKPATAYGGGGYWLGPTILDGVQPGSQAACEELFGPVLSVIRCGNLSEALAIENRNPFGNAVSVFTSRGAIAEEVARRGRAGMVGVNIGVPVPREPFSFGGMYDSKFGQGDITGESSLDLWTNLKKVTTKWGMQKDMSWMS